MTQKTQQADVISIDDFDESRENADGVEIELETAAGKKTGIHVTVIGELSDTVQQHVTRQVNKRRRQEMVNTAAMQRGKKVEARDFEDDVASTIEKAVVSTIGWRGPKEEFSKERLQGFLKRNPTFVAQILETSADASRFTKG